MLTAQFSYYLMDYLSRIAISKPNINVLAARNLELLITEIEFAATIETETVGLNRIPEKNFASDMLTDTESE